VNGTMLWFNEAKDYGFILTDEGEGERLYVDRDGFVGRAAPVGRCARLPVDLSVGKRDGQRVAVDVSLVVQEAPRRARRRTGTRRSAWS
jgi:'Cold-shock' DNA-binding domain